MGKCIRILACLAMLLSPLAFVPSSLNATDGYPWWLVTTVTPTAGYIRVDTGYGTNATTTVLRLIGPAITNMIINGRTTSVYWASGGSSTSTVSGLSALWYANGQSNVAAGSGENLIARDSGWWHLDSDGNVTPNTSETWTDYNWITNLLGELTPR